MKSLLGSGCGHAIFTGREIEEILKAGRRLAPLLDALGAATPDVRRG